MRPLRVVVLTPPVEADAPPDRADTFVQAAEIAECLAELGHCATALAFDPNRVSTAEQLTAFAPDLVVNLVEDVPEGADQAHIVTTMLDSLGLRYTGAPTAALAALGSKPAMKRQLAAAGLPVAGDLGAPDATYIVKSAIEHASIGLDESSVVEGAATATALLARRRQAGGSWFAEQYIDGREFNISLLDTPEGLLTLPIAEILFLDHGNRPRIVGYAEKWAEGSAAYAATPRAFPRDPSDASLGGELAALARAAWHAFGLRGYARVDFRVDARGNAYILEVNANPCLGRDAGFCAAAAEAGLSQTDIVARIIESALA